MFIYNYTHTRTYIYEVWQESIETDFFKSNVIPLKIVPLGSYTPMETLFPLLVAALEEHNGKTNLEHSDEDESEKL